MSINIPMPGNPGDSFLQGINSGSNLFSRIMNPILYREHQRQAKENFEKQMALRNEQFKQQMDIRKAALAQNSENSGIKRHILEQQLMGLTNKNNMQNMLYGSLNGGDVDLEKFKKNPYLRGLFKKEFNIDLERNHKDDSLHGAARDAYDLERLRNQVGDDSPVYQNALKAYNSTLESRKDIRDLRERTKKGLRTGEKEFFDEESGEPLGKEIPLTSKERESEEGNIIFNELYPHVYRGASPFSGEGSINRLNKAASNYKKDPKSRKLFDDFLLADKMLAATAVNEASTLKAGKTNQTYNIIKESLEGQDIPKLVKKLIKEYKLPPSAQLKAAVRYQELLSNARKKARSGTPATQKLFYDPEKQINYQNKEKENSNQINSNKYNNTDLVRVEGPNGIEVMTYEKAIKLGAK